MLLLRRATKYGICLYNRLATVRVPISQAPSFKQSPMQEQQEAEKVRQEPREAGCDFVAATLPPCCSQFLHVAHSHCKNTKVMPLVNPIYGNRRFHGDTNTAKNQK